MKGKNVEVKKYLIVVISFLMVSSLLKAQETFTDNRDGKSYKTVVIGNNVWMTENMQYETMGSWCYENEKANCVKYGRLYTWDMAISVCPAGWHLPTEKEWQNLEVSLGISSDELDESGFRGDNQATLLKVGGSSGFEAQYAGYKPWVGGFYNLNQHAYFWTATIDEQAKSLIKYRSLFTEEERINKGELDKKNALSVRCVKD